MASYITFGQFVAAHGLEGELLVVHDLGKSSSLKGLEAVFTEEKKESFLPWFIENTRIKSPTEVYVKLETIKTREAAQKFIRKKVWMREEDHKKLAAKTNAANLLGYAIIDDRTKLGDILEVIHQPHQILCRLEIEGKEVLIPIHEDTLKKIDHAKKQVLVELPEGLLDIYLE